MKKRLLMALLTMSLTISMSACGGNTEEPAEEPAEEVAAEETEETEEVEETEEAEDDGIIDFSGETHGLKYTRHEFSEDYEGNPCIVYYFEYTNNYDEPLSAMAATLITCTSNGEECDITFLNDTLEEENAYMRDVENGETVEACKIFSIPEEGELIIECFDWTSVENAADTQTITIE